ncbi:hypothetical protein JTE90_007098 [Oedothorax gibbosus]|uniref:Gustatory receptor n=1 Tax=Oedothorax gibbosus TaxID=931172 RepID=A0AAV6VQ65_9ARAC|nr:hypothetical protein JTE90_007098 [Oedothorax gibbosus]
MSKGCKIIVACRYYLGENVTGNITLSQLVFLISGINIMTVIELTFPLTIICIYCDICLTCKQIVANINNQLANTINGRISNLLIRQYQSAWKMGKLLDDSFSTAMIFLIMALILNLFVCLALIQIKKHDDNPIGGVDSGLQVAFYSLTFIATVEVSSQVADQFEKADLRLRIINEDIAFGPQDRESEILSRKIKAMIKKKPIVLSAFGIVYLRRKLIFAIFGSILTYGLLLLEHLP